MEAEDKFLAALHATKFCGTPEQTLIDATNDYVATKEQGSPVAQAILDSLATLPIQGASFLAIWFGAAVEGGGNPNRTGPALWETLCRWMDLLPPTVDTEADLPGLSDQQQVIADTIHLICQGLVAHLGRMPEFAQKLSSDQPLRERIRFLENYGVGFTWIDEVLARKSGSVLLLHAESRRALVCEYKNVGNCFHLFSMIQSAVGESLPGGRTPDSAIMPATKGEVPTDTGDEAWWHYGSPHSPEANIVASIFGESPVDAIPEIDGQQVIILWPMILQSRGWNSGFFGPRIDAAPPSLEVTAELTPEQAESWFARLGVEPA